MLSVLITELERNVAIAASIFFNVFVTVVTVRLKSKLNLGWIEEYDGEMTFADMMFMCHGVPKFMFRIGKPRKLK